MNIETSSIGVLVIVLTMALVTLATRWGGVYVRSFVPISFRVKQFISCHVWFRVSGYYCPHGSRRGSWSPSGVSEHSRCDVTD